MKTGHGSGRECVSMANSAQWLQPADKRWRTEGEGRSVVVGVSGGASAQGVDGGDGGEAKTSRDGAGRRRPSSSLSQPGVA